MKTTEKSTYRFGSDDRPRESFSYFNCKFDMNEYGNQGFIVPWQLNEKRKNDVTAVSFCG
jgi:hypothetical protein